MNLLSVELLSLGLHHDKAGVAPIKLKSTVANMSQRKFFPQVGKKSDVLEVISIFSLGAPSILIIEVYIKS